MRLFIDSGDLSEIQYCTDNFNIHGITTNPKLSSVSGAIDIMRKTNLETSIQIDIADLDILSQLKNEPLAIIKVPINHPQMIKQLVSQGFRVNCTLCFTMSHVIAAENLGATYASLFVGRGIQNGLDMYETMFEACDYVKNCKILAASIRNLEQFEQAAICGCQVATVSPSIIRDMMYHPLTSAGEAEFRLVRDKKNT